MAAFFRSTYVISKPGIKKKALGKRKQPQEALKKQMYVRIIALDNRFLNVFKSLRSVFFISSWNLTNHLELGTYQPTKRDQNAQQKSFDNKIAEKNNISSVKF